MKKLLVGIISVLMLVTLVSCTPVSSSVSSAVKPEYKNKELQTLCQTLLEKEFIPENAKELESSYIGAEEGYRFSAGKYGNIEIYFFKSFDGEYYKNAKENSLVNIFGTDYNAALSADGKFMLVYALSIIPQESTSSENEADLLSFFKSYSAAQ